MVFFRKKPSFHHEGMKKGFIGFRIPGTDNHFGEAGQFGQLLTGKYNHLQLQAIAALRKAAIQNTGPKMELFSQLGEFGLQG